MDLNEYQKQAIMTKKHWDEKLDELAYCAMGLSGEAGEAVDIIKKHFLGSKPLDADTIANLKKELGDVLWYIASMCDALDIPLNEIAQTNIEKLRARHGTSYTGFGNRNGKGA